MNNMIQLKENVLALIVPKANGNKYSIVFDKKQNVCYIKSHYNMILDITDSLGFRYIIGDIKKYKKYDISTKVSNALKKYSIVGVIDNKKKFSFDCERYVEYFDYNIFNRKYHNHKKTLEEYNSETTTFTIKKRFQEEDFESLRDFSLETSEESFISLLESKNIVTESITENQVILILEKNEE